MNISKKQKRYNLTEMRPVVEGYKNYSGTKKAYCREHNLNVQTFDYWRKRVEVVDKMAAAKKTKEKSTKKPSNFIDLPSLPLPSSSSSTNYVLYFPDSKRLELPLGVSAELLIQLLKI